MPPYTTTEIVEMVKKQLYDELKGCCIVWYDISENPTLPPAFERVCNQDGEPVFRTNEGVWKSVITGKPIEVTSYCNLPKRKRD